MMKRWMAVVGALVLCQSAYAEPPSEAEGKDVVSFLEENGLMGALAVTHYGSWLDEQITREIKDQAEFQAFWDNLNIARVESHAVSWWINSDEKLSSYAGGIGHICRSTDTTDFTGMFDLLATAEELAVRCHWKLWRFEYDPESGVLERLQGEDFDVKAGADWMAEQGISLMTLPENIMVDWAEFPDVPDLSILKDSTRQTVWSGVGCPVVFDVLDELEGLAIPAIDMKNYGEDGEAPDASDNTLLGEITVFTVDGREIIFGRETDIAQSVLTRIADAMNTCEPI